MSALIKVSMRDLGVQMPRSLLCFAFTFLVLGCSECGPPPTHPIWTSGVGGQGRRVRNAGPSLLSRPLQPAGVCEGCRELQQEAGGRPPGPDHRRGPLTDALPAEAGGHWAHV